MSQSMTAYAREIPARHQALSEVRTDVAAWLAGTDAGVASVLGADVALVVTELAANVVDHTSSPSVGLRLVVEPGRAVVVEVSNRGPVSSVPPVALWDDLADGERGRGLRLVVAVTELVEVEGDDEVTTIRARLRAAGD